MPFFVQWFGGSRGYADDLEGGLLRRHQHRYIAPKAAAAWLDCMREAIVARGLDADQVMAATQSRTRGRRSSSLC
jgi:truncated hemoglobin YjbI